MRFKLAIAVVGVFVAASASAQFFAPIGLKLYEASFGNSGPPRGFMLQTPAINYDIGGQGAGYNVPSPGCTGAACATGASAYRSDAVNFKTSTFGPGFPFQLGFSASPDSYNYTIKISTAGPYQITLWTSDTSSNGSWNVFIDNNLVTNVPTSNTGNFANFAPTTSSSFTATLGTHVLKLAWGSGDTSFGGSGDLVAWQGIQAGAPIISSVNMPCGNNCTFPPNTSGTIGNAQAVMANGTFSGSWSLQIGGSDHAGTACSNGSGFTISSSGLVSYPSLPVGTYAGNCLVATQAGAGGSPFVQAVTFTATSAGITPPAVAAAAGFTTVAADYDFTQPQFAVQSNWLDCGTGTAGGGSGGNNPAFAWHRVHSNNGTLYDCNVQQANDPATGTPVLDMQWLTSYNSINPNGQMFVAITGRTDNKASFLDFAMGYYQVIARQEGNFSNGGPNAFWSWTSDCDTSCTHGALEPDYFEFFGNGGFQFGSAGIIDHSGGGAFDQRWWQSNTSNNVNVPAGYTINQYHTYGTLLTSNGSSAIYACGFIDDVLQKCVTASTNVLQMSDRYYLILWVGGSPPVGGNEHLYVKRASVFTCKAWNDGSSGPPPHSNPTASDQCNGSTLFTGTQNGQTLQYWH